MIDQLILEISRLLGQSDGLSKRYNTFWNYNRIDNNVFAPVSTLFILECLKDHFSPSTLLVFSEIREKVINLIPKYANKDGKESFNFYPTVPSQHFKGGKLMHKFKHFKLADDLDDSALIYLVGDYSMDQKTAFKNLAETHATYISDFSSNKDVKVYNTWFADKMPQEIDCCVLTNMLFFVFKNKFPLKVIDQNTISYLAMSIDNIENNTFWLSRHYGNVPLIIYHYARLIHGFDIPELINKKVQLIDIALRQLVKEKVYLNKILLETSLIKMGLKREPIKDIKYSIFMNDFYSFIGAPLAPYKTLRGLAKYNQGHIFFSSEIQNRAFLVEYLILSEKLEIV